MATVTYNKTWAPVTTVQTVVDPGSGATLYTVTCEVDGLAPDRGLSADERLAGITSLLPPTVQTETEGDIADLMVRAILASYDATPGLSAVPAIVATVSIATSRGVNGALRLLSEA